MKREKEMIQKARNVAEADGRRLAIMPPSVPRDYVEESTEPSSGPIVLGQPVANGMPNHPHTPSYPSQPSVLTNGYSNNLSDLSDLRNRPHSNGTSFPSAADIDVSMSTSQNTSSERDTQSSSFGPSAQTRPFQDATGGPASLEQRKSYPGSLSQRSVITPMAEGSNPHDYTNYASTTSSDKKASGSSGPLNTQNTPGNTQNSLSQESEGSQGKPEGPDLSVIPDGAVSNSQMPETQSESQSFLFSLVPYAYTVSQTRSLPIPRLHSPVAAPKNPSFSLPLSQRSIGLRPSMSFLIWMRIHHHLHLSFTLMLS